jgi:hypothetical protein
MIDMTAIYDAARTRFSNPVAVTLTRPASFVGGAETSVALPHVQEQPAAEQEVESPMGGSLEGTRRAFRMWAIECGALVPHRGYLIRKADNTLWEITSVDVLCKGRQYRCHATRRPS